MISVYVKTRAAFRRLGLLVVLLGVITAGQAQQKNPVGKSSPKMAATDPLAKIGPELAALQTARGAAAQPNNQAPLSNKPFTKKNLLQIQGDYVVIEAVAEPNQTAQLLADLTALGLLKPAAYGRMVSGLMPIAQLDKVAALKNLHFARPAYQPLHNIGEVTSQGDKAMFADSVRKKQYVNGQGSKIGVLSDSYDNRNGAEKGIKSGDLPGKGNPNGFTTPVQVLADLGSGFGSDEGRAMLEIIHDVAPGAQLAFQTAFLGQASFAQGILDLQKAGCNIIIDDVYYFAEPIFQDGVIAQAVDEVAQKNVAYFSAAGNSARQSYEAEFRNSGKNVIVDGVNYGVAHDFGKGDITQTIRIPTNGGFQVSLQWDDPFFSVSGQPGAQTDMDVLVFYEGELLTSLSSFDKNIGNDPFEYLAFGTGSDSADVEIAFVKYSGPDPKYIKYINFGDAYPLEHNTKSSTIFGHANAAGAVATGAVFAERTPAFGFPKPVAESFSSAGGTPIFFDAQGNRKTRQVRRKPEIMAPDGANTTFFFNLINGKYYFFGTSAAAPHAAAVAALMQESSGNTLSRNKIKTTLQETALDMEKPGFDFNTGYGFINAFAAVEAVAKPRVRYFALVNAGTGQDILTISEDEVINLTRLPTRNVRLRALTGPTQVGSVVLDLNGNQITENQAPYDYPGSANTNFELTPGDYTLTATPYTQAQGQGEKGLPLTIHFKAVEEKIVRFELIDVAADTVLKTLATGDILYLPDLPDKLNIRAITSPTRVGSVQFNLNGVLTTENIHPYDLAGSSGNGINFTTSLYALSATTYPNEAARGLAGDTETIFFAAVNLSADQVPFADKVTGNKLTIFPNLIEERAKVQFTVAETGNATLTIYNLNGAPIQQLHNGPAEAGKPYEYILDGALLPNGWYISRLVTSKGTLHQRLRVVR